MKKLMSLMVLAAAAFAGGGMLNEHNLTTAINYLYHKQQVGSVISLGSITDTPPAALPAHLPSVPGAIPQASVGQPQADPQAGVSAPPPAQLANNSNQPAVQPIVAPPANPSNPVPVSSMPVPATPPPPLSIHWPDQTTSTYATSPKPDAAAASGIAATPPPAALAPDVTHSPTPSVPPPSIASSAPPSSSGHPKVDPSVGSAGFANAKSSGSTATEPSWSDMMRKMQSLGIRNIQLKGTPGGRLKLECEMAGINGSKSQIIEGEGETPQAAAQVALKRIVLFNAARRASRNSSQRASTTVASDGSTSSPIPQFSPPTPPESLPPPSSNEPLPPPADVPN